MKLTTSGQMREVIEIQRVKGSATLLADGRIDHSLETNWTTVGRKRAAIFPRGSREFWRDDQVQQDITHRVVLWKDSDVEQLTSRDRLLWGDRKLNVMGPPQYHDPKGRQVVIICIEAAE